MIDMLQKTLTDWPIISFIAIVLQGAIVWLLYKGLKKWGRELYAKKEFELIEELFAHIHKIKETMAQCRNPLSRSSEVDEEIRNNVQNTLKKGGENEREVQYIALLKTRERTAVNSFNAFIASIDKAELLFGDEWTKKHMLSIKNVVQEWQDAVNCYVEVHEDVIENAGSASGAFWGIPDDTREDIMRKSEEAKKYNQQEKEKKQKKLQEKKQKLEEIIYLYSSDKDEFGEKITKVIDATKKSLKDKAHSIKLGKG